MSIFSSAHAVTRLSFGVMLKAQEVLQPSLKPYIFEEHKKLLLRLASVDAVFSHLPPSRPISDPYPIYSETPL